MSFIRLRITFIRFSISRIGFNAFSLPKTYYFRGLINYCDMYKTLFTIALMLAILPRVHAQAPAAAYDKALADSLGANDFGMKMYTLVMLKTGPNQVSDKAQRDSLFRGHLQNIGRLAREGKLIVAGPLQANDSH